MIIAKSIITRCIEDLLTQEKINLWGRDMINFGNNNEDDDDDDDDGDDVR